MIMKTKQNQEYTPKNSPLYAKLIEGQTTKFAPKKVKNRQVSIQTITPNQAKHILKHYNTKNRRDSPTVVKKYTEDMVLGHWQNTGQTIQFDRDGQLLDGQHRLMAVISSGVSQEFIIVYGLEAECFEVIDNGKSRTNADIFGMKGYHDPVTLAALTRTVVTYINSGCLDDDNTEPCTLKRSSAHSISYLTQFVEENPDLVEYVDRYRKNLQVPRAIAAFCYWVFSKAEDKETAESFLDQVLEGEGLIKGTRNKWLFDRLQRNKTSRSRMNKAHMISFIFLAWRRHVGYDNQPKTLVLNWDHTKGLPKAHK